MPQDSYDNINSKEIGIDSAQEDFVDLIEATKDLKISLDKFTTALEKIQNSGRPIPVPTYSSKVAAKTKEVVTLGSKYSYFYNENFSKGNQLHGFKVDDIIKVENTIKSDGFIIPDAYKYGKVTRFNDRYVFFNIKYLRSNTWYSYEAWRAPHNISHAPYHKWNDGN